MNKLWSIFLACTIALGSSDVLAKRLGGGLSFGKQSGNVTQQRSTTPPAQQGTAQPAPTQNAAARPATASPAAATPQRPWGAMLGGLVLGIVESLGAGYLGQLTGGFLGSHYQDIFAFAVLLSSRLPVGCVSQAIPVLPRCAAARSSTCSGAEACTTCVNALLPG